MEERQIVLDFTGCKYITEVHWRIRDTFHFPGFYGENLDALWDMREYFLDKIMGVFYDIENYYKDFKIKVRFKIKD